MQANARYRWRGQVRVIARGVDGRVSVWEGPNQITDAGRAKLAAALRGEPVEITHVALGADNTPPSPGDVALGDERFRKPVTAQSAGPGVGQTVTTVYIAPGEANGFPIEEIGWFTADGTLIARVLYSREKTALESLQIDRTDTIS